MVITSFLQQKHSKATLASSFVATALKDIKTLEEVMSKNSGAAAAVVMAPTGKCTKPKSSFMLILTYLGMLSSNNSATSSVSSLDAQPQCSFCTASCHGSGEKNVGGSNQATANCFCPSCLDPDRSLTFPLYNVRGSAGG